jgi:transposase-like protein
MLNRKMAYSKEFKLRCVRHFSLAFSSISEVAEIKDIPKQTLARWVRLTGDLVNLH